MAIANFVLNYLLFKPQVFLDIRPYAGWKCYLKALYNVENGNVKTYDTTKKPPIE